MKISQLLLTLSFVPFLFNYLSLNCQAQTTEQQKVEETIIYKTGAQQPIQLIIEGPQNLVNSATIVATMVMAGGSVPEAAQIGVDFALAGADPDSVINLILAMGGMISNSNQVDINRLHLAITAFNSIVNKADFNTLNTLQNNPKFMDIRSLLMALRKPIG